MRHIITKFGGTSVSSRERWNDIVTIIHNHLENNIQPIVVCSALSQASNQLEQLINAALVDSYHALEQTLSKNYIDLANALGVGPELISEDLKQLNQWLTGIALLKEAPPKTKAQVLSLGELMMTRLGAAFFEQQGLSCLWFDARNALTSTPIAGGDSINYLAARCEPIPNQTLAQTLLKSGKKVVITQGFIAYNQQQETVLLGRGGSDTSAALLAATLEATACEIWTDVPGIYSANPYQLPNARLLKQLNYYEAQEIASMGAKVLHPNCIPPVRRAGIPLAIKFTRHPAHTGTRVSQQSDEQAPPIKSIQVKHGITLISIDTLNMWQQVGFLADIFVAFKTHGFSVDLLSSSEFNVTVSLDANTRIREPGALEALLASLNQLGRAKVIEPCSALSLVGHHIRMSLPQLGPILEIFDAHQIYLMSLASNDLNLTFVVDESHADKLCQKLHAVLIENNPHSFYYSKSWQEEFGQEPKQKASWWQAKTDRLLKMAKQHSPCYVYNISTIQQKARELRSLKAIDQLFFAIKANPHPEILQALEQEDISFECVSLQELQHVRQVLPNLEKSRLLFTPNFSSKNEYQEALAMGCYVTVDNLYPLQQWPTIFHEKSILLRLDPGSGAGHHKYVCTGGNESKFGIPLADIDQAIALIEQNQVKVIGLHTHSGSGILTPDLWQQTAQTLTALSDRFPDVSKINLGGGLGIVEKPGQQPLNLSALNDSLEAVKSRYPNFSFWLEPGRYFVAESGVLLAKVTQQKEKGNVHFVGIETGMNSLLRPALYGAYHEIVNLSRLEEDKTKFTHVVGPICESGDTLGYDRLLPETQESDVFLIANAGAYGHCMASNYNLRPPAEEIILSC